MPAPAPATRLSPHAAPAALARGAVARAAPEKSAPARAAPESLHPALWRAHQLGRQQQAVHASGYAELDVQLPGGGWPASALTELLLPHPGVGELRLLAPALAAVQQEQRSLLWLDPPAAPCAWALAALGLDLRRLVIVRSRQGRLPVADLLWALEQALASGHLGAVLAWLPARLPADALRRLQLAAQGHDGPAFLLRGDEARLRPSAAPLRLALACAGPDELRLTLLKRRGPPLAQPLRLALPPVLSPPALARALRGAASAHHAVAGAAPASALA
ncbi:RecA/RadA recombinase [Rubrivivax sp. A210]|uniref:translesion DNA synthesis-associated protein ImuA n=1 Tax=Rubrivivax sp. A210 TaxID=2772301 RepID=UPI0019193961|nr:translesion DNA synthesis-associated protein ImuA [Rubrivivax sp. A210]CAD5372890.1 RecA/RadA recombinase [Rubrivivax sp. A210]